MLKNIILIALIGLLLQLQLAHAIAVQTAGESSVQSQGSQPKRILFINRENPTSQLNPSSRQNDAILSQQRNGFYDASKLSRFAPSSGSANNFIPGYPSQPHFPTFYPPSNNGFGNIYPMPGSPQQSWYGPSFAQPSMNGYGYSSSGYQVPQGYQPAQGYQMPQMAQGFQSLPLANQQSPSFGPQLQQQQQQQQSPRFPSSPFFAQMINPRKPAEQQKNELNKE